MNMSSVLAMREKPGLIVHCEKLIEVIRAAQLAARLVKLREERRRFERLIFETLLGINGNAEGCNTGRGHE
jgi:hypothetical protein